MNVCRSAKRLSGCVGVMLAAGLAQSAAAVDKSWNSDSGLWSEAGSWSPVGIPAAADHVFIGNRAIAENHMVTLNINETIAGLTITDGMTFRNSNRSMVVNGDVSVSGANTVNNGGFPTHFPSTVLLEPVKGLSLYCDDMSVSEGARFALQGQAFARYTGRLTIGADSMVFGVGHIDFEEPGTTFVNNGSIVGGTGFGIRMRQFAGGLYDLDGTTGDGVVSMFGGTVRLQGTALTDAFSGRIEMMMNADLEVVLSDGWTADENSVVSMVGSGEIWNPARIRGEAWSFGGELSILGGQGEIHIIPSEFVSLPTARFDIGDRTYVEIGAAADTDTTIDGGTFSVGEDAELRFIGDTQVNGGVFETFSTSHGDGFVSFEGATRWAGAATFHGIVRQMGDASIFAPSTINADVIDMDGSGGTSWSIGSGLTINAAMLDTSGNDFDGSMNIGGGAGAMLTVNLAPAGASWGVSGSLRLGGSPGFFLTRLAGSPVVIYGDLEVASGRSSVSAPLTIANQGAVDFEAANTILRTTNMCVVYPNAIFTGNGVLQSGPTGDLTLLDGLTTAGVGIVNQGTLRIGEQAGIAAVNRFETTGVWEIEIGGLAPGAAHDQLIVAGSATLGGTLDVRIVNGFRPAVGDTFTILAAAGGVTGAFPANVVTIHGAWTYNWTVTSNANDVVLRLSAATGPCIADFNADGVVNSQDFFDFLTRFFAVDASADVNVSGAVNSQDFFDFLSVFFEGCD